MDTRVNHESPNAHWIVVLDAALAHVAADFRAKMSKDTPRIKLAFVEPAITSVSQPLDRAIMLFKGKWLPNWATRSSTHWMMAVASTSMLAGDSTAWLSMLVAAWRF
eukprot:6286703-Amphidinium_carterae.2